MNEHIKVDNKLHISIKRMGINGEGIGYFNKLAIFVDQALPEEELDVIITHVFDNRAIAKIEQITKKNPDRREPFCSVYEICGGCQTQHFDYDKTLVQKRDILIKSFDRYIQPKVDESLVKNTIGCEKTKHYRNKASLPVQKTKGRNQFGMYARNSNQFVPIKECPVQNQLINHILNTIIKLMDQYEMDAIDPKTKKGYVRYLIVRVTEKMDQAQVSFIMEKQSNRLDKVVEELVKKEPKIVSVVEVKNSDLKKPGFFAEDTKLLYGDLLIEETLADFRFLLRPDAFFQLNTPQANQFYLEMRRLADLKPYETAIDAYAGVAPISHYIFDAAKHVYAIEIDASACESAKLSLEKNNITNVTILKSDFNRALSGLKAKKIDVMFFDPPRTGLGEVTIESILKFKPKRLIYGSCNPSTLAKDLNLLLKSYRLIETVPIDMFPYTSLVESVSLLIENKPD